MPTVGEAELRQRVEVLERALARVEAEFERRPVRHIVAHNAELPVVRGMRAGDMVVRGSGGDAEFYLWNGSQLIDILA